MEWHRFNLAFVGPGFQAKFPCETWIASFVSFRDGLARLNTDLRGNAKLEMLGNELNLQAEVDKLGHVTWTGELRYPGGMWESRLEFIIEDDQTSLSGIIAQVDAIIAEARSEPLPAPSR